MSKTKAISIFKLLKMFSDNNSAFEYLWSLLWNDTVKCSRYCEHKITQQKDDHNY